MDNTAPGAVRRNEEAACDVCGKYGAFEFSERLLCQDCYANSCSCCPGSGDGDDE